MSVIQGRLTESWSFIIGKVCSFCLIFYRRSVCTLFNNLFGNIEISEVPLDIKTGLLSFSHIRCSYIPWFNSDACLKQRIILSDLRDQLGCHLKHKFLVTSFSFSEDGLKASFFLHKKFKYKLQLWVICNFQYNVYRCWVFIGKMDFKSWISNWMFAQLICRDYNSTVDDNRQRLKQEYFYFYLNWYIFASPKP